MSFNVLCRSFGECFFLLLEVDTWVLLFLFGVILRVRVGLASALRLVAYLVLEGHSEVFCFCLRLF